MNANTEDINHLILSLPQHNHLGISYKNVHTGLFLFSGRALSSWCMWKVAFLKESSECPLNQSWDYLSLSPSSRIFSYGFIWLGIGLGSLAVLCPWLSTNHLVSLRRVHCRLLWWKSTNGYLKFFSHNFRSWEVQHQGFRIWWQTCYWIFKGQKQKRKDEQGHAQETLL